MSMQTIHSSEHQEIYQANQRYLSAALAVLRARLERHSADAQHAQEFEERLHAAQQTVEEATRALSMSSPLETLCQAFDLSPFERDIVLLCAAIELDSTFAALCAAAQGDPQKTYPTFSLALAALSQPHWSALTPAAPLRYWRLIEVGVGSALTVNPLRIDERVLHYLVGVDHLDERLVALIKLVQVDSDLVVSHTVLAQRILRIWSQPMETALPPLIQMCGDEIASKRTIAATACNSLGLRLYAIAAHTLSGGPNELDALIRLWERECVLSARALLLDCDELDVDENTSTPIIAHFVEHMRGPLLVSGRMRRRFAQRPGIIIDVQKQTRQEQFAVWQHALGPLSSHMNSWLGRLVSQFSLDTQTISSVSLEVLGRAVADDVQNQSSRNELSNFLWEACRSQARPRLADLAQHIEPAATWEDLVLPEQLHQILREIVAQVRQRNTVYETWGFAARSSRGLGISALFSGASGTGKTMAAEVLAHELQLDLYHIDLSAIVSKYIGETEKNLRRVFDAAEGGGAVLLFDEADALFGKRSEVKDSHDRYANIEVSYLLQRMEAYRGLAILTTNMKSALDAAFLRRIRFIIQFPFPDAAQRAEIWRRIFPSATPTTDLDIYNLAHLNVAGGNIRNIALNAAFLAAEQGEPVRMKHLLRAARSEYAKLERPLTEAETGGWL